MLFNLKIFFINVFDLINDLRLHIIFNFFLLVSWFLYTTGVSVKDSVNYAIVSMVMLGFVYLLNRYTDYSYDLIVDKGLKKAPRKLYLILSILLLFLGLLLGLKNVVYLVPILVCFIFGTLYSVKIFFKYPLKNYLIIKDLIGVGARYLIILGGVLLIPGISNSILAMDNGILFLFIKSFPVIVFIIIYELLWDIRDMRSDKIGNVKTVPLTYGKNRTLAFCFFIWLCALLLHVFYVEMNTQFFLRYFIILFFILSVIKITTNMRWFHLMVYTHIILNLLIVNKEVFIYIKCIVSGCYW